ncbi:hypothetical protein DFH29DRAFT_880692 [Suillus ampliporus]|nr:hypothetical protein DFH29DRAFT_880692 [Suillus ampliporus]
MGYRNVGQEVAGHGKEPLRVEKSQDVVLENTPEVLQDFLADHYTTWAEFEADVAKTSTSQLVRAKQRIANNRKLREDVDKLQNQTSNTRKAPYLSSSQATQPSFSLPAAYRYGPHYIHNPATPPQPAPPYQTIPPAPMHAQLLPAAPAPQTPQNPFSGTASVPRTNLFYGYQGGYPQTPLRGRGASGADRARAAAQYAVLIQHPDSDSGRQAYVQQIQEWNTQNGADATPNTAKPYLLKPGTSPLGSRECARMSESTSSPGGNTLEGNGITTCNTITHTTPNAINTIEHSMGQTLMQQYYPPYFAPQPWQYDQFDSSGNLFIQPAAYATDISMVIKSGIIPELSAEDQLLDSEFVVPTLEIEIVSPLAASIVSSSNLPTVHDSLESVPASCFTSSTSSLPSAVKWELETTDTADCYSGVTKPEIVDLYSISDNLEEVTESVPFTTQTILYGPGRKTSCFQANLDDRAMVNIIDLKVFHKPTNGGQIDSTITQTLAGNLPMEQSQDPHVLQSVQQQREQLGAMHDYAQDAIIIPYQPSPIIMYNIRRTMAAPIPKTRTPPEPIVHDNGGDDIPSAPIFLIVTIPPDEIADSITQEKHGRSISNTEHYVFKVDTRVTKDQLELCTEDLARAGAHVVQPDQWPIVSPQLKPRSEMVIHPYGQFWTNSSMKHWAKYLNF